MKRILPALLLATSLASGRAATITWTNIAGGNWNQASNWQPNQVPGAADTANITTPGTYTVTITNNVTVANLNLGGASGTQTLVMSANTLNPTSGTVNANGVLAMSGGSLAGQLTVAAGGELNLLTTAQKQLYSLTLVNAGTVNWAGGPLVHGATPTTVITNSGLWDIQGDFTLSQGVGGPAAQFINTGTLRKSAGAGVATISTMSMDLGGVLDVQTGTLRINSSGSRALGAATTVANGAVLDLAGGNFNDAGGTFGGAGVSRFSGGTLTLNTNNLAGLAHTGGTIVIGPGFQQAGAITNLTLDGSTLSGADHRVGTGTLTVNSGGLAGQLTVAAGGELNLLTTAQKQLYSLTLVNAGTVNWAGGPLVHGATPTTVITNSGLWDIQGDFTLSQGVGGPAAQFINTGTLRKSAGAGVATISTMSMDLGGVLDVQTGTLRINSSGSRALGAATTVANGAVLDLAGGNFNDAGGTFGGAGVSRFSGGTLTLNTNNLAGLAHTGGTIVIGPGFQQAGAITNLTLDGSTLSGADHRVGTGTLTVNSGGLAGQLTVAAGGELNLLTTAQKQLYSLTLVNAGTVNWAGGPLVHGATPTTVITNSGLWDIQGDFTLSQGVGGPAAQFINTGTLRKSAGAGVATISTMSMDLGGVLDVQTGTLRINSSGSRALGAATTVANGAVLDLAGGNFNDAGGTFGGAGVSRFSGGTLTLNTNNLAGLAHTGGTIVIGPGFQQAGAITNLTLDGSTLSGADHRVGTGTLTVNSGGLAGQLTVAAGGELNLLTTAQKQLYSLTLVNAGTVNWAGGPLVHGATPTTVITNSGLWDIQGDFTLSQGVGGPAAQFINTGTLRKSAGAGVATISTMSMDLGGVLDVQTGTLRINSSGSRALGAATTVANGAVLDLAGGNFNDAGGTFGGAGVSRFSGGTLTLNTNNLAGLAHTGGTIVIGPGFQQAGAITNLTLDGSTLSGADHRVGTGTLTVNSGGLAGQLTVAAGGELNLLTTAQKQLYSLTLVNAGTVNWAGGPLVHGATPTTVITNSGLWDIQGDFTLSQGVGGPAAQFINTGTLRKSAGAGVSQFSSINVVNTGLVQADSGTLRLPGGYVNSAGTLRLGGGRIDASGVLSFAGGTLDGTGSFGNSAFTGGIVSPGVNGPGRIAFASGLNVNSNVTLVFGAIGTTPGTEYDQLAVTGSVTISNATVQTPSLSSVPVGTALIVIDNDGVDAVQGAFMGFAEGALFEASNQLFRIRYASGTGNDVAIVRDDGGVRLTAINMDTNGHFNLRGLGTNFAAYAIQASTNFLNWDPIGSSVANGGGLFFFTDTNAFNFPRRFYRSLGP